MIPYDVNITDFEMLSNQGMVSILKVTIHYFVPITAMQRGTEIILIRLLETPLADTELTVELALSSSLRSPRFLNIFSFSCKNVAFRAQPKKSQDLYISLETVSMGHKTSAKNQTTLNTTAEEISLVFLLCALGHGIKAKREAHAEGTLHRTAVF